jgi:hypothetical protein
MPPSFAGGAGGTTELRAYYYDRLWRQWSRAERALGLTLNGLPFASSGLAIRAWRSGFRRRNLAEIEARRRYGARIEAFLDQDERKGIHAIVNRAGLPLERNVLKNKLLFEQSCRAAGLPLPQSVHSVSELGEYPALISKPRFGSKGQGVHRLIRQHDGGLRSSDGLIAIPAGEVGEWLFREQAEGRIVQECLSVHPALADISPGALPTLRVVTVLDERRQPEITDMALRLSLANDRAADNFNIDNLVAPVDLRSGLLGPALRRKDGGFAESAQHPLTGAPIAGEILAQIEDVRALALAAHGHFAPSYKIIGWDIGLSDRGPILIEGNWNPGYNVLQLVHGVGLGELRIGALYRFHLERAPNEAWSAASPMQFAQQPFRG